MFHVSHKGDSWGETHSREGLVPPIQEGKIGVLPFITTHYSFVEGCPSLLKMYPKVKTKRWWGGIGRRVVYKQKQQINRTSEVRAKNQSREF